MLGFGRSHVAPLISRFVRKHPQVEVQLQLSVNPPPLTDDAFDRTRFDRRFVESFEGARLPVSRPEDTILMKLRWAAMLGGSEKQFMDALRVYEVQHGGLDEPYLDRWAAILGVSAALIRLRAEARPIEG